MRHGSLFDGDRISRIAPLSDVLAYLYDWAQPIGDGVWHLATPAQPESMTVSLSAHGALLWVTAESRNTTVMLCVGTRRADDLAPPLAHGSRFAAIACE